MDPYKIISKFYKKDSQAYSVLISHSELVRDKALQIARGVPNLNLDLVFINNASLLHDIGIFLCDAPDIGCFGKEPYIKHGVLGRELLDKEGFPKYALVCERHMGVGITKDEIIARNLPLPHRDLVPVSVEEKCIALADLFYSKSNPRPHSIPHIRKWLSQYGSHQVARFDEWIAFFGLDL